MVLAVKNLPAHAGDTSNVDLISGLERSPGIGNGNPLRGSCLENPMGRGVWWATRGCKQLDITAQKIKFI